SFGAGDVLSAVFAAGLAAAVGLYVGARREYMARLRERALFARALASFLPEEVARLVQASPSALSLDEELEATVLFSDIRGFSSVSERLGPRDVAAVVGRYSAARATSPSGCSPKRRVGRSWPRRPRSRWRSGRPHHRPESDG